MSRPPRPRGESIFGRRELGLALVQGGALLLVVLGYFAWLQHLGAELARTCAFIALVSGQISLALANRSSAGRLLSRQRLAFWAIATAAMLVLGLCLSVPFFIALLRFAAPSPILLVASVGTGLVAGGWSLLLLRRAWATGAGKSLHTAAGTKTR